MIPPPQKSASQPLPNGMEINGAATAPHPANTMSGVATAHGAPPWAVATPLAMMATAPWAVATPLAMMATGPLLIPSGKRPVMVAFADEALAPTLAKLGHGVQIGAEAAEDRDVAEAVNQVAKKVMHMTGEEARQTRKEANEGARQEAREESSTAEAEDVDPESRSVLDWVDALMAWPEDLVEGVGKGVDVGEGVNLLLCEEDPPIDPPVPPGPPSVPPSPPAPGLTCAFASVFKAQKIRFTASQPPSKCTGAGDWTVEMTQDLVLKAKEQRPGSTTRAKGQVLCLLLCGLCGLCLLLVYLPPEASALFGGVLPRVLDGGYRQTEVLASGTPVAADPAAVGSAAAECPGGWSAGPGKRYVHGL